MCTHGDKEGARRLAVAYMCEYVKEEARRLVVAYMKEARMAVAYV